MQGWDLADVRSQPHSPVNLRLIGTAQSCATKINGTVPSRYIGAATVLPRIRGKPTSLPIPALTVSYNLIPVAEVQNEDSKTDVGV